MSLVETTPARPKLFASVIEPLIHMSLCPDKSILAGFLGSFALYQLPARAGGMMTETLYP
jgi:hypothetical protein